MVERLADRAARCARRASTRSRCWRRCKTYAAGQGARGQNTWTPVPQVVDALDGAFYAAFENVEPTGARTLLALDVSGSMECGAVAGVPGLTPRVASAAMALVTAATEKQHEFVAFTGGGGRLRRSWRRPRAGTGITPLDLARVGGSTTSCEATQRPAVRRHRLRAADALRA